MEHDVFHTVLRFVAALPLGLLRAVGAGGGIVAMALSPRLRAKARDNLRTAALLSRRRLWAHAAHLGAGALETVWVWFRPDRDVVARIDRSGLLDAMARAPHGCILLTPHLGGWEAAGRAVASVRPITVLYKPPRQPRWRALVHAVRTRGAMTAAPADTAGVRMLLRALRDGDAVGILPDQVPTDGDGQWAPFFGRPALTMTLPGRLAQRSGLPVMLCIGWRTWRGWRMQVVPVAGASTPAGINAALEAVIRLDPDQYLWTYNRYKVPAGVAGPDDAQAAPTGDADARPVAPSAPAAPAAGPDATPAAPRGPA